MAQRGTYLTPEGLTKLEQELESLRTVRRQEVAQRIQRAKEIGGTVDNAEYEEAKNEQAFVEGRIRTLETMLQSAVVIQPAPRREKVVTLGSHVAVRNPEGREEHYVIVGRAEADPLAGRISNESPVGKCLMGKKEGETVEVRTPAGVVRLKLIKVSEGGQE